MTHGPSPFVLEPGGDAKRFAPATERNRDAIAETLAGLLPERGMVLEIASGTGEHSVHFAQRFPHLTWQPSDFDPAGLASIAAWTAEAGHPNILPPLCIDATAPSWPVAHADAILCINMVHIAPWAATRGLFAKAAQLLPKGGLLYFYGPYTEADVPTADSNSAFDATLRARNPEWGLRDLAAMEQLAADYGMIREARISMPANNLSLAFRPFAD